MEKTIRVVLDTSIFVNPDSRYCLGETPFLALSNFLDFLKNKNHISCFMPPTVYEELMKFIEGRIPLEKAVLLNKKPPASYETPITALFLYEFIEEMRGRVNKGLRIAEKYARRGLSGGKEEEIVKTLRDEYRVALREGVLDSKEDFDLILLAKELSGYLATSDNGLVKWAHKLGVSCLSAPELKELINKTQDPGLMTHDH